MFRSVGVAPISPYPHALLDIDDSFVEFLRKQLAYKNIKEGFVFHLTIENQSIPFIVVSTRPKGENKIGNKTKILVLPPLPPRYLPIATADFKVIDSKIKKVRDDYDRLRIIDELLPSLKDFSGFFIDCDNLSSKTKKLLLLDDDIVFLVFVGNFLQIKPNDDPENIQKFFGNDCLILLTNHKLLVLNSVGKRLFDYEYILKFLNKQHLKETLIRKREEIFRKSEEIATYPIDYEVIYNVKVGLSFSNFNVTFKRKDRPQQWIYEVNNLDFGLPHPVGVSISRGLLKKDKIKIRMRHYPMNSGILDVIDDKFARVYPLYICYRENKKYCITEVFMPDILKYKVFIDGLRRVTEEKRMIWTIMKDAIKNQQFYTHEIVNTKEEFRQLKCQVCGASEFKISELTIETPEGKCSLLKCKYCGAEGIILKERQIYKVTLPIRNLKS